MSDRSASSEPGRTLLDMTVNEAIRRYPSALAIFQRFGVDACCGGALPVRTAAERHGADPSALRAVLDQVVEGCGCGEPARDR